MAIGKNSKGFTLLELLVVIAIIGIMLSVVVLSTDFLSRRHDAKVFGQKIQRLIIFSSEIAISRQQEVGIKFYPGAVSFMYKKDSYSNWDYITDINLLKSVNIPRDIKFNLQVESIYKKEDIANPEIVFSTSGEMTPFQLYLKKGEDVTIIKGSYNGHVEIEEK